MNTIQTLHSYRATVIPKGISPDDAQVKSMQGALPYIQLKARNADRAAAAAHWVTGRPVIEVVRLEGGAA